jgi:hypothetical protein
MGVKRRERHYGVFSQFVLRQIELATAAASNPDAVRILLTDRQTANGVSIPIGYSSRET